MNDVTKFQFNNNDVRAITDETGDVWFVVKDVCDVLGHTNPSVAMNILDAEERSLRKAYPPAWPDGVH